MSVNAKGNRDAASFAAPPTFPETPASGPFVLSIDENALNKNLEGDSRLRFPRAARQPQTIALYASV
jgi:hypothetical protein